MFDEVILSTDSELIAYTCQMDGVRILQRPESLSGDDVASVPVFRHIVENFLATFILTIIAIFPFAIALSLQKQLNWPGNQVSHSVHMQFGLKLWIAWKTMTTQ